MHTGSEVEPARGYAARITAPHFRATVDGFLVWSSFPRLARTGIKVDPEGLPHVLSRLTLALPMSEFFPLVHSGGGQLNPPPPPGREAF